MSARALVAPTLLAWLAACDVYGGCAGGGIGVECGFDDDGTSSCPPGAGCVQQPGGVGRGVCAPRPAVAAIAAGTVHSCAVSMTGVLLCWGDNAFGQVGDGTSDRRLSAVAVEAANAFEQVGAGDGHTCAIDAEGALVCWGDATSGQTGRAPGDEGVPTLVDGITSVSQLAAGRAHTCVLDEANAVLCFGENTDGQLGHPTGEPSSSAPNAVARIGGAARQVTAGGFHSCAILEDERVRCWGDGRDLAIGAVLPDGVETTVDPVDVVLDALDDDERVDQVSAGGKFVCAKTTGGRATCWGIAEDGRLGAPVDAGASLAVLVEDAETEQPLTGVVQVASGRFHACALIDDGTVRCWGTGTDGQLGDGNATSSPRAVRVGELGDVARIAAGYASHSCALTSAGDVLCWGKNDVGQIGDGTVVNAVFPRRVVGLP